MGTLWGKYEKINKEEDINMLKYLSNNNNEIKFEVDSGIDLVVEFYKYIYQKYKFTIVNKLVQVINSNLNEVFSQFLDYLKFINKFLFLRKWDNRNIEIKIKSKNSFYKVKNLGKSLFSYLLIKNVENALDLLINRQYDNYDCFLYTDLKENDYNKISKELLNKVSYNGFSCIKFPPFKITSKCYDLLSDFSQMKLIDISFIIYLENEKNFIHQVYLLHKNLRLTNQFLIIRIYIVGVDMIISKIIQIFKKAMITYFPYNRLNLYFILYIFERDIFLLDNSDINPFSTDEILEKQMNENLEGNETIVLLNKYLYKICFRLNYQILSIMYCIYSSAYIKKLKKKPIMFLLNKYLNINIFVKVYNNNSKTKKKIFRKYLNIQQEYSGIVNRFPHNITEVSNDLIHIFHDEVFNIVKFSRDS